MKQYLSLASLCALYLAKSTIPQSREKFSSLCSVTNNLLWADRVVEKVLGKEQCGV